MNPILRRLHLLEDSELFGLSEAVDAEAQSSFGIDHGRSRFRTASRRGTPAKLSASDRFDGPVH